MDGLTGTLTGDTMRGFGGGSIAVGGIQLQKVPLEPHDPFILGNENSPGPGMSPMTLGAVNTLYPPTSGVISNGRSPKGVQLAQAMIKSP